MNVWRRLNGLPLQDLMANPRTALTVEYVCGKQFRIKNALPYEVTVHYEVAGSPERKLLHVAKKPTGQPHGVTLLDVDNAGELRLIFDGEVILTTAHGGTSCP